MPFFLIWAGVKNFIGLVPAFVWKWLALALIGLCLYVYGDIKGKRFARAECEAKAAIAQTAANDQDLQAEKNAHANDLEVTNNLKLQKQVDDVAIENLKAQLAKRPVGSKCVYDKSNSDPDDPAAGGVRLPAKRPAPAGASNKKHP